MCRTQILFILLLELAILLYNSDKLFKPKKRKKKKIIGGKIPKLVYLTPPENEVKDEEYVSYLKVSSLLYTKKSKYACVDLGGWPGRVCKAGVGGTGLRYLHTQPPVPLK